jgi:TolB-like protein/DNA-binding winged helix-turn-helix (wHTH) protein
MSFWFGEFELDQERRQLLRSGEPVPLEPKAYELLSLLLERRPRALSRAQIRDVIWPGTFVSESTLAVVVNGIRHALGDDARAPRFIRTVHGFGYAFCGEARMAGDAQAALEAIPSGATVTPAKPPVRVASRGLRVGTGMALLAAVATAAVLLDVGGLRRRLAPGLDSSPRSVRLAVLPFANLSGDPEEEYLSDGITQEMIAQLGRLHPQSLSVIARTSVMRYKKTDTPIDRIGRELGVAYVLEGSARREGGRIRISAELIQVRDQTQLWADVYERDLSGILALQAEVARKVAGALALKLLPAEEARLAGARPVDPEAYAAHLKGSQHWIKMTKDGADTAKAYFDMALRKDPDYAAAYAGLACCPDQRGHRRLVQLGIHSRRDKPVGG